MGLQVPWLRAQSQVSPDCPFGPKHPVHWSQQPSPARPPSSREHPIICSAAPLSPTFFRVPLGATGASHQGAGWSSPPAPEERTQPPQTLRRSHSSESQTDPGRAHPFTPLVSTTRKMPGAQLAHWPGDTAPRPSLTLTIPSNRCNIWSARHIPH